MEEVAMVGASRSPFFADPGLTAMPHLRTVRPMNTIDLQNALLRLLGPAL
ncbi:hypothetical protein [Azospirillum palustre]